MIYLQNIEIQLSDAFTNLSRVAKFHVPTATAPVQVDISTQQIVNANESRPCLKRGRPIGSKDENPRKRKGENDHNMKASTQGEPQDITNNETTKNVEIYENNENEEISISYVSTGKR